MDKRNTEPSIVTYLKTIYRTPHTAHDIHDILDLFSENNLQSEISSMDLYTEIGHYYSKFNGRKKEVMKKDHTFLTSNFTAATMKAVFPDTHYDRIQFIIESIEKLKNVEVPVVQ